MNQVSLDVFSISNTKAAEHGINGIKTLHRIAKALEGLRFDFQCGSDLLNAIATHIRSLNIGHLRVLSEELYRLNFDISEGGAIKTEHVTLGVSYVSTGGLVRLGEITLTLIPVAKKYLPDMSQDRFDIKGAIDMEQFEENYREKGRFPEVITTEEEFIRSNYATPGVHCRYNEESDTFSVIMPFGDDVSVVRLYKPK